MNEIPGVPAGMRLKRLGVPKDGEIVLLPNGETTEAFKFCGYYAILEPIERPKKRVLIIEKMLLGDDTATDFDLFNSRTGCAVATYSRVEEREV